MGPTALSSRWPEQRPVGTSFSASAGWGLARAINGATPSHAQWNVRVHLSNFIIVPRDGAVCGARPCGPTAPPRGRAKAGPYALASLARGRAKAGTLSGGQVSYALTNIERCRNMP